MTELRTQPSVYNIPAGESFADTLALGLMDRVKDDPMGLSEYLILLPSRRACRTLQEAFLRLSGGRAILLPRMQPVGDVDAEEVALLNASMTDAEDIPDALPKLERQLLLARTIMKGPQFGKALSFDQAVSLASDLGKFLDEVHTEGLSFENLENLVPDDFSDHWQQTIQFLTILTDIWPDILKSRGMIDHALRRNLLLSAQVNIWKTNPPHFPVVAAGSTGTIPAVRELLSLVSTLPRGMLILPGMDADMDDASWDKMGEDHPQFNIKKLMQATGVARHDVDVFYDTGKRNLARVKLLSESMRPADTTEKWRDLTTQDIPSTALNGLTRIDCKTPQEEADIIALIMRETLQTPDKTIALITPDRRLARRVSLSLRRWGIQIDDSGGQPLTEMSVGTWLMLTAEMAVENLAPITLLSCLKHPMMAAGMEGDVLRQAVYLLDQWVMRGPRPAAGILGLRDAIDRLSHDEKHKRTHTALLTWFSGVENDMQEFVDMMSSNDEVPFRKIIDLHLKVAENLARTTDAEGKKRLWKAEAGESASAFLTELLKAGNVIPALQPKYYVSLLRSLLKSVTVRPKYGAHPRLSILGQIEARLYCADKVILGGLNEGTWPEIPAHDPWMSRPMRKSFGLPAPEKSISLSSHDFVQAATAPEVVLTRAQKVEGTPTVPARWLLRMEAVLAAVGLEMPVADAQKYQNWLHRMDAPDHIQSIARPAPKPPVASRPRKMSITDIEKWMRDPYQIYARYILNLRSLDDIDEDPGAAERGTFIHQALEEFVTTYPKDMPENAVAEVLRFGKKALTDMRIPPEVEAFWWPRFERIADAFVTQEISWRENGTIPFKTEAYGVLEMAPDDIPFTLTGQADRIDRFADGTYAVIDYKSGAAPSKTDVKSGISPQLSLEALMLKRGAFENEKIPAGDTSAMAYWQMTGVGKEPIKMTVFMESKKDDVNEMALSAETGLFDLIKTFNDENTPYYSMPRAEAKPKFSDYTHLARIKEWSVSGDEGEDVTS